MSGNTNKLFWLSTMAIVVVVVCFAIFNNVGGPSDTLYNNANQESLCNALSKNGLVTCLDASSNSAQGSHNSNNVDNKATWFDQKSNYDATLSNFDFNDNSGWNESFLSFDGIDDLFTMNLNNYDFGDKFSLQMNLKLLENVLVNSNLLSNDSIKMSINSDNKLVINIIGDKEVTLISQSSLQLNAWYTINVVYDNDLLKLYINGQLDNSIEAFVNEIVVSNNAIKIGGESIKMLISSLAIYNTNLTDSDINQNVNALNNKTLDIEKYYISFDYTNNCKEWTAPVSGNYQFELWGAQGGSNNASGGKGAYTSGNIDLNKDSKLYVCVGGSGNNAESFNGGGIGTYNGGGATDVRLNYTANTLSFDSLKSRIMIAAGGGASIDAEGGVGGLLNGLSSNTKITGIINATGGKQNSGGLKATKKDGFDNLLDIYTLGNNGSLGRGGDSVSGAGGGAGYFGGGSISSSGGAAGGSSYISGYDGSISLHAASTEGKMIFYDGGHYSGYEFNSGYIVSGNKSMPNPVDASTPIIGKEGNGYAKITLINSKDTVADKVPNSKDYEQPGIPVITETLLSDITATITFSDVENVQEYICRYGRSPENLNNLAETISLLGQNQKCRFTNLEQNTNYYVQIEAVNGTKSTLSEIKEIKTDYSYPTKAIITEANVTDNSLKISYETGQFANENYCYIGTTEGTQDLAGVLTDKGSGKLECVYENLTQNTDYFLKFVSKNGNKETVSDITKISTKYSHPTTPVLTEFNKTKTSISLKYETITDYTEVNCYFGSDSSNIVNAMDKNVINGAVVCSTDSLIQGTTYYSYVEVINGTEEAKSEITTIKTNYEVPNVPVYEDSFVTDSSITTNYIIDNDVLQDVKYSCSYGLTEENMNLIGSVSEGIGNTISCSMTDLSENTNYYTRITARNGSEAVNSETKLFTTDYVKPTAPVYNSSYIYNTNGITATYIVANSELEYSCKASLSEGGSNISGLDINNGNGTLDCQFANLDGGTYYFYAEVKNGPYKEISTVNNLTVDEILPTLSISTNPLDFNANNWAKTDVTLSAKGTSAILGRMRGLIYCIGENNCTPTFTREQTEDGERIVPGSGSLYLPNSDNELNKEIIISNESANNKICASIVTSTSSTATQCYGPYAIDKTAPVVSGSDLTVADTVAAGDIYQGISSSDNLSTVLSKTYIGTVSWGYDGTYPITYTYTDDAGNSSNITRNVVITKTTFSISYNLNGGSLATKPSSYTKRDRLVIGNPTRTGYNFTGWTVSGGSGSATIPVGTTGNMSFTANWTPIRYFVDVNPIINNATYNSGLGSFTFNVYLNGALNASGVTDWSANINYGTVVRVTVNGRNGYNIQSSADMSYTVTGALNINPAWYDNIAPGITGHWWDNWGNGSGFQNVTSNEAGVGIMKACYWLNGVGSFGSCVNNPSSLGDRWYDITVFGTKTFVVELWDYNGNYSSHTMQAAVWR